ncbi:MAG: translational GTPase TypA [Alphaproteobacteria bacterium]|nr:translational GTPase TypA [Alphaproteobacteria bacterium]
MELRNIAVIAHVDHGKTTLIDAVLRQSGTFRANQQVAERALDSNDLERERGITILAKCTSIAWGDTRINIVDTPGHADFGGEVERILSMVDGALLLVDAAEGPMPQTKFVVGKALARGLRPIVVINKVDRSDARPHEVQNEVFDLFAALDANDEQLDFPTLFAVGRDGWAAADPSGPRESLRPLLDLIVKHVPRVKADADRPFSMLATILESDPYLGRVITGRIHTGRLRPNMIIKVLDRQGQLVDQARLTKVLAYRGLERVPLESAEAGDIIAVAGLEKATVSQTLCDPEVVAPIPSDPIDPPTLAVSFWVNDSPLAGREGDKITSRMLRGRLLREAEGNVAITVRETERTDAFEVAGRGELQLGVLIETMRREGFELAISRPRVLFKTDETGKRLEPIEECVVDVDEEFAGVVVDKLSQRKGELVEMRPMGGGKQRLRVLAPTRGLIGYHGEFLTDTRGTGVMHRIFHGYAPYKGEIGRRRNGVLISTDSGRAVPYALWNLEERGAMFIDPGVDVYRGMIIGEHSRGNDLDVNPLKEKHLTNIRTTSKDEAVRLTTPRKPTLEQAIAYIEDDELVEVTPRAIRLRKRLLEPHERKRASRAAE